MVKLRETTKKQLDLQEVLHSKMSKRYGRELQQHLKHAVQAATLDLSKSDISTAEALDMLELDPSKLRGTIAEMPQFTLFCKIDNYNQVTVLVALASCCIWSCHCICLTCIQLDRLGAPCKGCLVVPCATSRYNFCYCS